MSCSHASIQKPVRADDGRSHSPDALCRYRPGLIETRTVGQTRFLDLPDELLRIILGKLIDAAGDDKAISCIRARLTSLLVCKDFKRLALEIPLSLYSEEALYDAQVMWFEKADGRLQNLAFLKEEERGSWWLEAALRAGASNLLTSSSKTLQSIVGLVFVVEPDFYIDRRRKHQAVASLDLRGFSALQCLSLACDHQMQLWLPAKMQHLEINMVVYGSVIAWNVTKGWDLNGTVERLLGEGEFLIRQTTPMLWGERVVVAPVEGIGKRGTRARALVDRPTWVGMLRGVERLDTLMVQGCILVGAQGNPWTRFDLFVIGHSYYYFPFMGLADFDRDWPTGLAIRSLHVRCTFVPFDLVVRDVELLHFSEAVVFLTRASCASDLLDTLLAGQTRVVRFCARSKKRMRKLFTWVGPGIGRGVAVHLVDVAEVARSPRFAGRIAVKKICTKVLGDGYRYWCLDLVVVARRMECDEEPGPFVCANTLSRRRHRWTPVSGCDVIQRDQACARGKVEGT